MTRLLVAGYAVVGALLAAGSAPAGTAAVAALAVGAGYVLLRSTHALATARRTR